MRSVQSLWISKALLPRLTSHTHIWGKFDHISGPQSLVKLTHHHMVISGVYPMIRTTFPGTPLTMVRRIWACGKLENGVPTGGVECVWSEDGGMEMGILF